MSYYWENVIWQSKDGSWNRGYFHRISMASSPSAWNDDEYGYDSEWDDEFDFSYFDYLSTGMSSKDAAWDFEPQGNPGSANVIPYAGNSKHCKHYDLMAHWHRNPAEKAKAQRKDHLRKVREHFKTLDAEWPSEAMEKIPASYASYFVVIKGDERVYEQWGVSHEFIAPLRRDGDWLTVEGKRVYNLKTGRFDKRVHKFEKRVSRGGFGYRRF